ncbi:MAG: hypothetical protein Q8M98_11620 [Candidatus Cloacimonadaceae bacterium]|nr:hypothetical protein [Candidatus Cloacimonadaceae bacterium]
MILDPIISSGCSYEFYQLDRDFLPDIRFDDMDAGSFFLYTNYFGLCDKQAMEISKVCPNLIVDNSQAFFSRPINDVPTFYSPRKYFGVPDGAYLYPGSIDGIDIQSMQYCHSHARCSHLLKRIDLSPEDGYGDFKDCEKLISSDAVCLMSKLSRRILGGIDYNLISQRRRSNYQTLHKELGFLNELELANIDIADSAPLIYPLLLKNTGFKERLIRDKIYIATYWDNVYQWTASDSWEWYLTDNLIALPIDQRYNESQMKVIIEKVLTFHADDNMEKLSGTNN